MRDFLKHLFDRLDFMQFFVGVSVMLIFFMLIWALIYRAIPEANKDMVNHAIGLVEGAVIMVVGYYYGSSKGSAMKDQALKTKDDLLVASGGVDQIKKPGITIVPEPGQTTTTEVTTQ